MHQRRAQLQSVHWPFHMPHTMSLKLVLLMKPAVDPALHQWLVLVVCLVWHTVSQMFDVSYINLASD